MGHEQSIEQARKQPGLLYADQEIAYNLALRLLGDSPAALQTLQTTVRRIPAGHNAHLQFLGLVVALCRDRWRTRQATWSVTPPVGQATTSPPGAPRPPSPGEAWLEQGIWQLPFEQRAVLLLHDAHSYTYEEVAEIAGLRVSAVETCLAQARRALRDFLQAQGAL
ncbi:MAG: hypothetical protein GXY79_06745 [Chloroflexi bacterium]|nr:hypothetical protein [Chloroflexota bacterium]